MNNLQTTPQVFAELSKKDILLLAQNHSESLVEAAMESPIKTLIAARKMAEYGNELAKHLIVPAMRERETYPEKDLKVLGAKIEIAEVGVKYDYSEDQKWRELKIKEEAIAEERKSREKLLQALKQPMIETDPDTGETFSVPVPVRTSSTSLKVTL